MISIVMNGNSEASAV